MNARGGGGRTHVLLLTNTVQTGGMEEHVRLIAKDLDRDRFDVTVAFPDWPATNAFVDRLRQVADRVVQVTPDRRYGTVPALREAWRLGRLVREQKIDVAHLHSTTFAGQWLAVLTLRFAGLDRIFVTEHLAPDTRPSALVRFRRRLFGRLVTGIICVSERNRAARAEHLHTPDATTHVVVNGIDLSRFDEPATTAAQDLRDDLAIREDALVVGTAIRLEPGKGVMDLVDAFVTIHEQQPTSILLIVGDGSRRSALEERVAEHGLTDHVVFTGFVDDPRDLIRLMDVFVLPVPFGSASIGLLEAMAMSRPCVISFGGEGEAVEPGHNGFWAEPSNPASIANYVSILLRDDRERHRTGENARSTIEQRFSSQRVATELSMLYVPE